jgi:hypothetical protein
MLRKLNTVRKLFPSLEEPRLFQLQFTNVYKTYMIAAFHCYVG